MAHPKRKISNTRRDKRRTHQKLAPPGLALCPTTGTLHPPHQAFWKDHKLYYRGQVVLQKDKH